MKVKIEIEREKVPIHTAPLNDRERMAKQRLQGAQPRPPKPKHQPALERTAQRLEQDRPRDQRAAEFATEYKSFAEREDRANPLMVTQTEILKKQTEILMENQKILKHTSLTNIPAAREGPPQPLAPVFSPHEQEALFHKMLAPLQAQLDDIRKLQQEQKQVRRATEGEHSIGRVQESRDKNRAIGKEAGEIGRWAEGVPNQIQLIGGLQEANAELYQNMVAQLKQEISALQKESDKAERQLYEKIHRIEKITSEPKFVESKAEPYAKKLTERSQALASGEARHLVVQRLGGEFDYIDFVQNLQLIRDQLGSLYKQFQFQAAEQAIVVPKLALSPADLKIFEPRRVSVLDEFKAKHEQLKTQVVVPPSYSKERNVPPSSVRQIPTKPVDLSKQVRLQKESQQKPKSILEGHPRNDFYVSRRQDEMKPREPESALSRLKKNSKRYQKQEAKVDKYLEYQADLELQAIMQEAKHELDRMKLDTIKEIEELRKVAQAKDNLAEGVREDRRKRALQSLERERQPKAKEQEDEYEQHKQARKKLDLSLVQIHEEEMKPRQKQISAESQELIKARLAEIFKKPDPVPVPAPQQKASPGAAAHDEMVVVLNKICDRLDSRSLEGFKRIELPFGQREPAPLMVIVHKEEDKRREEPRRTEEEEQVNIFGYDCSSVSGSEIGRTENQRRRLKEVLDSSSVLEDDY